MQNREYQICAEIGQAVALPSHKNYKVKMTIGGHELIFDPIETSRKTNYKRY